MSDQNSDIVNDGSDVLMVPNHRDAEEALLGSILINPIRFNDVAHFLEADDFYILRHKWIYEALRKLTDERSDIDVLTVSKVLDGLGHLEDVGGTSFLMGLASQVPTSQHAEAYGRIIEGDAVRRRMLTAANEIAKLAFKREQSIDEVVDEAERTIFTVAERRNRKDLVGIRSVLNEFFAAMLKRQEEKGDILGVPTGIHTLDKLLGGMQKSDFLIVAGRPGMGKTGFLIGALRTAAVKEKKKVAMFSLEMSNDQLVQRMISQQTGISSQRLRSNDLTNDEIPKITAAIADLEDAFIYLDDTPAITPLQMRAKCRRLHSEVNLDLVIVDYLQLMSSDARNDNRVQEVSAISRNLKVMARELKVPVLAAAQLNRGVEQRQVKTPVLSDLRESGSLEQDADIVIFLNYDAKVAGVPDDEDPSKPKNANQLIVAKHRNGPTNPGMGVIFEAETAMFIDPAFTSGG